MGKASSGGTAVLPVEHVEHRILLIRGEKVILDMHLAELYGVPVKRLNQAIKRNPNRFPRDFMFRLTAEEMANLRSQIVTSSWGGRRYPPYAFTEHGAIMAASVLNSPRAVLVSDSSDRDRPRIGFRPG
ncbi:MAG TPA: ORF6N domain-containing protein [Gemmatimonadales bacterium]|nr:ORF6N domain-containing protein [Gemmatimonadales bacterium]